MGRASLWLGSTLLMPALALAQSPIPDASVKEGSLSFDGHATAGDFTGTTTTVTGSLTGGSDLSQVHGWAEAPVQTLKTGNGHRDRDLNKSMESDKYATIRYELSGVSEGERSGDSISVTLHGNFLIHGVTRPADLPAWVWLGPDAMRVKSDVPLNLNDYKIGGLSKMLGLLKMYPDIVVHIDVSFLPATP